MIASRAKFSLILGFCAALAVPAAAQLPPSDVGPPPSAASRDASFLPMTPAPAVPATPAPVLPVAAPVTVAPAPVVPPPSPSAAPTLVSPPPAAATTTTPSTLTGATTLVAPATPQSIAKPVEAAQLANIDPESIGLLSKNDGGLGADIWKGTTRLMAGKLLKAISLPTSSKSLNDLARRLFLTVASAPEGTGEGSQSFLSQRIEKLLALGDAADAWKLTMQAKPELVDEITLRLVAEAALISPERDAVCAKLPEIVQAHNSPEWQKLMLICQLRANDAKAAQLTIDLLRTQNVKDDIFFYVAEKNIIGGNKQLPRQLTPLKPLTLALLRMVDSPLPGDIYARPDAILIPELLAGKGREDVARLGLAERAAERGIINATELAAAYRVTSFPPEALANAGATPESGPRLRALLYQAALQEKTLQNRVAYAVRYMQTANPDLMSGAGAEIAAAMLGEAKPSDEFNTISGTVAHIYVLAGKNDAAMEWMKQARHAAIGMPPVAAELNSFWPLAVFSGLESGTDYATSLDKWLDAFLKNAGGAAKESSTRTAQAAALLLLVDADGFAVSNENWVKVIEGTGSEKRVMPSALLLERLRAVSTSPKRGETVLLALALAGSGAGNANDIPALAAIEIVRALRMAGFITDAALFAREAGQDILNPGKP